MFLFTTQKLANSAFNDVGSLRGQVRAAGKRDAEFVCSTSAVSCYSVRASTKISQVRDMFAMQSRKLLIITQMERSIQSL